MPSWVQRHFPAQGVLGNDPQQRSRAYQQLAVGNASRVAVRLLKLRMSTLRGGLPGCVDELVKLTHAGRVLKVDFGMVQLASTVARPG
ncbi:hypothetical protein [Paenarthrobacter aurescens]|uniref:hypothetical protein n=1 Tax=Paenarthrobacter aurescens TaxID=43663 RepID=UPI0011440C76|nr:hypothetical protein [Paenarthrobacter aurescens]MDO6142499.1 hypothetical protein [Paenarthrobacter aurescens]MDO6146346.1 hypothetical protein [Paenarthrobacter aurescens]MDO6157591.1 hypothetical protein [Paenarthrobacter aurescens]MDO6161576.1 hypothetical protein [Paenarthrobacter aurescens]